MSTNSVTIEAIFEDGVLRPVQRLPLSNHQKVTLTLHLPGGGVACPEDVVAIYQEIAEEDRRLAEAMFPGVRQTWPTGEAQP